MLSQQSYFQSDCSFLTSRVTSIVMPRAYVPDLITANECTKNTASFCSTKISTVIKDAVQSLGYKEIRKDQFQNFLNTWCDHEIADSAQPRYRSIVTRPFSLLVIVRAGSGHETNISTSRQWVVHGMALLSYNKHMCVRACVRACVCVCVCA